MLSVSILLISALGIQSSCSLRILGIFPHTGESHIYMFKPLMEELARRGHEVTVISHFPRKHTMENYKDISLSGSLPVLGGTIDVKDFEFTSYIGNTLLNFVSLFMLTEYALEQCKAMMDNVEVQAIKTGQFDLVFVEHFNSDCALGIAHHLRVPYIAMSSHIPMPCSASRMALVDPKFYSRSHMLGHGNHQTTFERLEALVTNAYGDFVHYHFGQRRERNILKQYYGDDLPNLAEVAKNTSLYFLNTHPVLHGVYSLPPNVIEVGGLHIRPERKLEEELQKFLDEADDGVVVFSMGSMVKETTWPDEKLKVFRDVFSGISQKVLWKWKSERPEGLSENVQVSKWLPQADVLRHKNVKLFIAHAGCLGLTEAINGGVPVVAIPLFGDQFNNAASAADAGVGVVLTIGNLTQDSLKWAIQEGLSSRMQSETKRLSKIWKDRPMSAMDTAVYWTEYVARNGALHLRDRDVDTPFFKLYMFDLIAILLFIGLLDLYLSYVFIRKLCKTNKAKSKRE